VYRCCLCDDHCLEVLLPHLAEVRVERVECSSVEVRIWAHPKADQAPCPGVIARARGCTAVTSVGSPMRRSAVDGWRSCCTYACSSARTTACLWGFAARRLQDHDVRPRSRRSCGRGWWHNLAALRQVGFAANRRLLDVQPTSHDPFIGTARLTEVAAPVIVDGDRRTSGLRFGDPVVHALLACLLHFPPPPGRLHQRQLAKPAGRRPRHRRPQPQADELPATGPGRCRGAAVPHSPPHPPRRHAVIGRLRQP
jgi:hypothetical protein